MDRLYLCRAERLADCYEAARNAVEQAYRREAVAIASPLRLADDRAGVETEIRALAQEFLGEREATETIAAELPADRILVETDAPYLAPGRHRGKRNEPAFVIETAKMLAQVRNVTLEEIAQQTTENFYRLFNKVPRPAPVLSPAGARAGA